MENKKNAMGIKIKLKWMYCSKLNISDFPNVKEFKKSKYTFWLKAIGNSIGADPRKQT